MLLLAADSFLLFFITYFTGMACISLLKKITGNDFIAGFFDTFLAGLMTCFTWFNLVSFFAPVNYIALLPLLVIAIIVFAKRATRESFFRQLAGGYRLLLAGPQALFTLPLLLLFFVHWIVPPANPDSSGYHFVSILWYEKYKVVPGLANLHGRLAFNPANFIISAAWSFTSLAGQALYPLNGVLALLFYAWLVKKIRTTPSPAAIGLMLCGILLFRNTLVNISSPSADMLSTLLLFYSAFGVYENIREGKNKAADFILPAFFFAFSITAKLFSLPLVTVFIYLFIFFVRDKSKYIILMRAVPLLLLLLIPWIIRNFIMSGYLAYPILHSNLFKADWAVPASIVNVEHTISQYGPRAHHNNTIADQVKEPFSHWFLPWLRFGFQQNIYFAVIYTTALLSPLLWWAKPNRRYIPGPLFVFWVLNYINVWLWLWASPEPRFGLAFLTISIGLPLLTLLETAVVPVKRMQLPALFFTWAVCAWYGIAISRKPSTYHFTLADCWLKPLRSDRYYKWNDKKTFPYQVLSNGVRLYISDDTHDFLNADFPARMDHYLQVEMRGPSIKNGFRAIRDDTKQYVPYVE